MKPSGNKGEKGFIKTYLFQYPSYNGCIGCERYLATNERLDLFPEYSRGCGAFKLFEKVVAELGRRVVVFVLVLQRLLFVCILSLRLVRQTFQRVIGVLNSLLKKQLRHKVHMYSYATT